MTTQASSSGISLALCFMLLEVVVFIGLGAWMFPWEAHQIHTMELLPATMGELDKTSRPITVSKEEFLTLAKGEQVTATFENWGAPVVIYEVIHKGLALRYYQRAPDPIRYSAPDEYEVKDSIVTLTYSRNTTFTASAVLVGILLPLFLCGGILKR